MCIKTNFDVMKRDHWRTKIFEFDSCDPVRHTWAHSHRPRPERDWGHAHYHKQRPASDPPQGICCDISLNDRMFVAFVEIPSSADITTFSPHSRRRSTSQAILCDVPRLQYVIVVDSKPSSWTDVPRGIMIYSMDAVKEMGSKPDNSECLCSVIKKVFLILSWKWKYADGGLTKSRHA